MCLRFFSFWGCSFFIVVFDPGAEKKAQKVAQAIFKAGKSCKYICLVGGDSNEIGAKEALRQIKAKAKIYSPFDFSF